MDMLDKRLSGPIFRLQLGTVLECLLSVRVAPLACLRSMLLPQPYLRSCSAPATLQRHHVPWSPLDA